MQNAKNVNMYNGMHSMECREILCNVAGCTGVQRVVWCAVVWSGLVWSGLVWCGVVWVRGGACERTRMHACVPACMCNSICIGTYLYTSTRYIGHRHKEVLNLYYLNPFISTFETLKLYLLVHYPSGIIYGL